MFGKRCIFHGCRSRDGVRTVHICHDLHADLCIGHARMSSSVKHSDVALIEFLVKMKGNSPEYRSRMRKFVLDEIYGVLRDL